MALFDLVINFAHHVEALVDVGLHGNGGVDHKRNAGFGRAVFGILIGIAGVDGGHTQKLYAVKGVFHVQYGHEIKTLFRNSTLRVSRFAGENGHGFGRWLLALPQGSRLCFQSVEAFFHIGRGTQFVQASFCLEKKHRVAARARCEQQGERLVPVCCFGGFHPAFGLRGRSANLNPAILALIHIHDRKGHHAFAHHGPVCLGLGQQRRAGMADHPLKKRLFALLQQGRGSDSRITASHADAKAQHQQQDKTTTANKGHGMHSELLAKRATQQRLRWRMLEQHPPQWR